MPSNSQKDTRMTPIFFVGGVQDSCFTTASLYVFRFMTHVVCCYKSSFLKIITPIYVLHLKFNMLLITE